MKRYYFRIYQGSDFEDGDTVWTDGAEFDAAIVLDTSIQARIGEKQGVTALYTVTTAKAMNLQYHDVFRRTGHPVEHAGPGRHGRVEIACHPMEDEQAYRCRHQQLKSTAFDELLVGLLFQSIAR